jgi:hypothetical protein
MPNSIEQSPHWEDDSRSVGQEMPCLFVLILSFITVFTKALQCSYPDSNYSSPKPPKLFLSDIFHYIRLSPSVLILP